MILVAQEQETCQASEEEKLFLALLSARNFPLNLHGGDRKCWRRQFPSTGVTETVMQMPSCTVL